MTIVDSLKRLAKTITGKDLTGETVAEVVDGLNDNYPGSSGGSADFKVIFTVSMNGETPTITAVKDENGNDLSVADILAAATNDKNVYGLADTGIFTQKSPLTAYGTGPTGHGLVTFGSVLPDIAESSSMPVSIAGSVFVQEGIHTDVWNIY